ncbi:putative E3 ubiquitin-protein ligase RNF217 isoform X1 [Acipenser oxyrinchus oxyrinchus]|uniref:E3 ubiquitin-protein ligase RNF217 isoform X1 n=1 Tax=Acipenser oxyrinchus oxyrinchus TaxID=40147 RepID=A0AAD8CPD3_ACIOX|nr:putative E3 ubiquitin-protein ligase RNF217 isoform X1 [Acipenser oxyrinchus oxyrinchus]
MAFPSRDVVLSRKPNLTLIPNPDRTYRLLEPQRNRGNAQFPLASCGHSVNPADVTESVKSLLDQKSLEFRCPVCDKEWSWRETRKLTQLPEPELCALEERVNLIAQDRPELYKKCPACSLLLQRPGDDDASVALCVACPGCSCSRGKPCLLCWACLSPWQGGEEAGEGAGCTNKACGLISALLFCSVVTDPDSRVLGCPLIRACPKCHQLTMHTGGCKYVCCQGCRHRFCFICLERSKNCKRTGPGLYWALQCSKPRAERQRLDC